MKLRGRAACGRCRLVVFATALTLIGVGPGSAQPLDPPRPPAPVGIPTAPPPPGLLAPGGGVAPPTSLAPPAPPAASVPPPSPNATAPIVPAGQVALNVSARYGKDQQPISAGLHWRIYSDHPDQAGVFRILKDDRSASPNFLLPPGGYVVHVAFGLTTAVRRVQLRSETVREIFDLPAGGTRFEGRVGESKIPPGQIVFDVYRGSQFEPGDKRPIAKDVGTGDVVLLPEGVYHVVSNYGDGNAVVRSDIRVSVGKLTDVTVNHRAAAITLKLVTAHGGEAIANTQWWVVTPGGDTIKESNAAFPRVVLAEGEYQAVAKNEGTVYGCNFKVDPGVDGDVEVMAKTFPGKLPACGRQ